MDILIKLLEDNPWFGVVTAAIAFASAITAATPTPKKGSIWALNIGKAKDKAED